MSPRGSFVQRVEFIGGPYDGLRQAVSAPLEPFLALNLPRGTTLQILKRRLLHLLRLRPARSVHVSIYELSREGPRFRYHYCGTQEVKRAVLANKRGLGTMDHPPCGV